LFALKSLARQRRRTRIQAPLALFFNSTPSLVGRLRSERLAVWVWSQGSVLGSDWPPRDCRQCGRRTGTEGERRLYTRAPALACATFQSIQFPSESYCFSQRGRIAALVSGEVWRSRWLCMVTAFHSCLALAQSGSCGSARPFTQLLLLSRVNRVRLCATP